MNKWLHKWRASLGSGYPSASSPYWRALPIRHMTKLLLGTFFTAAGVGFAVDLLQLNHPRLGRGFFWPIFGGAMAAGLSAARIKKFRLAFPLWLVMVVLAGLAYRVAHVSRFLPLPDRHVRESYSDANVKANEYLYRRVDIEDVVSAHLLATRLAPSVGFRKYIVSATMPFHPSDLPSLRSDAPVSCENAFQNMRPNTSGGTGRCSRALEGSTSMRVPEPNLAGGRYMTFSASSVA